ncbi:MAG: NAD(P)-dependent oxidoreductase [SAR324 cluster bacterium]|jgi:glutamate synthase (NADPH/NADH) small chain|nr:dihydropyrimidine dehydrogenase [Deltaproteobacteria bacterium]MDP6092674.1 NAD(P)-dependent oxidoreductase [SAR324 cluster bacterium]MDP6464079.1 NAD(P)-dependent oxidoreductase [SAR324 cluster bacterium]MDP7137575.1 NAD(P)-dependent oxidoreductase [SAR324 cluster bacterium]MDP7498792.1 NAD(P)-dependent oxidoreductase [SAR324 cluster bacterium]|tara:strand:+ start:36967 stop:38301 length:1335 start_codon:yes stop_codon:yes gene_type:complete
MPQTPDIQKGRLSTQQLAQNFEDIHPPLDYGNAILEAQRCYYCFDAPCVNACPTQIDIPSFIRKISSGNTRGSAKDILSQNIMGGMCARVCPTEVLCEGVCVRNTQESKPVRIGALQRYSTDWLMEKGDMLFERAPSSGKRVAVIGGGPAGLSCAHRLAMLGHEVVVFEAREKMSGLNEYGIAAYKTVDDFAQREVEFILSLGGIKTQCGVSLGKDLKLSELKSEFDAVFLGIGLGNVNQLEIGDTPLGVFSAVDYIEDLRQASNLENLPVARRVIVIGGGSTAIDIAVQSKKLGAEDVTLVYRRGPENMSATNVEQEFAQVHDVKIRTWLQPNSWLVENGQLSGIRFEYTELNSSGKLMGKDEFLELETDSAFLALGQKMTHKIFELELEMNSGKLAVDENGATSQSGIWAGGDCITAGKDLTVHAVEQGKQAAIAMDQWLRN